MKNSLAWVDEELERLQSQHLRRELQAFPGPRGAQLQQHGQTLINFGSNDYLGLAADPRLTTAVAEALKSEGWGAAASPLVTGRSALHAELESALARFEGTEATLLFPSGFAANVGTIGAVAGKGDAIFSDAKNHASIIDGCRLSGAKVVIYQHRDVADLRAKIAAAMSARRRLIVTDTVFSMDGDLAPLSDIAEIAEQTDAMLMVDEAHATGVFGKHGRGIAEKMGVEDRIDIRIGTLSKALGSVGGFVAGSRSLIHWLLNRARPYVFSTAQPATTCAAALAALKIVEEEPARRTQLLQTAQALHEELTSRGRSTGNSGSQIIPVFIGDAAETMRLSAELAAEGFWVPGIRPPSVPSRESLLRISLSSSHTEEMVSGLVKSLCKRNLSEK